MKNPTTILKWLSIVLCTTSLLFIIYSFYAFLYFNVNASIQDSIANIYTAISTYSGLYKFTFVVCAFWATIKQLELAHKNYETTSAQIDFIRTDINEKKQKEVRSETLEQCFFYMQEMQILHKELIDSGVMNGATVKWRLTEFPNEALSKRYPNAFNNLQNLERDKKNVLIIALYKIEAFSAFFVNGDLDRALAKRIIGYLFVSQVGYLMGAISYFRNSSDEKFGHNTIQLFSEWASDDSIFKVNTDSN